MKTVRICLIICILFWIDFTKLVRGSTCPTTRKQNPDDCRKFYRCVILPDSARGGYVWVPSKCAIGLIYQPYLQTCVLPGEPGEPWECRTVSDRPALSVFNSFTPTSAVNHDETEVTTKRNDIDYLGSGDSEFIIEADSYEEYNDDDTAEKIVTVTEATTDKFTPVFVPQHHSISTDQADNISKHLQHLTQLIASLQNKPQIYEHNELSPAQLNTILAQQNIVAEGRPQQQNKESIGADGKLHPTHMSQILAQQNELSQLQNHPSLFYQGNINSYPAQKQPPAVQKVPMLSVLNTKRPHKPQLLSHSAQPLRQEVVSMPQDTWNTVLSLSQEMLKLEASTEGTVLETQFNKNIEANVLTETAFVEGLLDDKNKIISLGTGGENNYISVEKYKNSILPLLKGTPISILPCASGIREPNMTDCTRYYVCNTGKSTVFSYSCPPRTAFNKETRICESAEYAKCRPEPVSTSTTPPIVYNTIPSKYYELAVSEDTSLTNEPCNQLGKIADPISIRNYYICFKNKLGKLVLHKMTCQNNLQYCEAISVCTVPKRCNEHK